MRSLDTTPEGLREAVRAGKISQAEREKIIKKAKKSPAAVRKLKDLADDVRRASPADQRKMKPILQKKLERSRTLSPEKRKEYLDILRGSGR